MEIHKDNKWKYPKFYIGGYGDLCFGWRFGTVVIGNFYGILSVIIFILLIIIFIFI